MSSSVDSYRQDWTIGEVMRGALSETNARENAGIDEDTGRKKITDSLDGIPGQVTSGTPPTGLAPELYEGTRYDLPKN
jgi:hypothetical protein